MINFSFGDTFDLFNIDVEITIGETMVGSKHLSGIYQMVVMQCSELINQTAQDERPMKIVFRGKKTLDLPNGNTVEKPARVIFANTKYADNFELNYE